MTETRDSVYNFYGILRPLPHLPVTLPYLSVTGSTTSTEDSLVSPYSLAPFNRNLVIQLLYKKQSNTHYEYTLFSECPNHYMFRPILRPSSGVNYNTKIVAHIYVSKD